jgi:ribulose kinase
LFSLGLDIGSSSVKAALTETLTGKKIAFVQEPKDEMEMISVQSSWAEQDPNHWWKIVCIAIKKLLQKSGVDASQVQRIGIAYQMHGLVVVMNRVTVYEIQSFGATVGQFRLEKKHIKIWVQKNAWITCSIALQTLQHPN